MIPAQSAIEDEVRDVLKQSGPCTIDEVIAALSHHNWNMVFSAVNTMSRDGRIVLRRLTESVCQLSLPTSGHTIGYVLVKRLHVRFCVGCGYLYDEIHPDSAVGEWVEARHFLTKYAFSWGQLNRIDSTCPGCARVLACARTVRSHAEEVGVAR
jgi:hypothetical protein